MVDFIIAGTFKAATSTLSYELARHPDIFIPKPKDPYFFLAKLDPTLTGPSAFLSEHRASTVLDRTAFDQLFADAGAALTGEATPLYLYCHEQAIPAIRAENPDTKIILILRNPADRAFSNFNHNRKDGFEKRSFAECIDNWQEGESLPLHPFFHYIRAGFYDAQVAAYQAAFRAVKIVTYEQVVSNSHLILNEIAAFLGIAPSFEAGENLIRLNKSGMPRLAVLHRFIKRENALKSALRPVYRAALRSPDARRRLAERVKNFNIKSQEMPRECRARLNAIYSTDIARVSERIGVDLAGKWGL